MNRVRYWGWVLLLAVAGCSDECESDESCGSSECGENEHCDNDRDPPRCVCDAPYSGLHCDECAPGYSRATNDTCEPDPVSCASDDCGPYGTCENDRCVCAEGYKGNTCASCADGFQDENADGVCSPACGSSRVTCGPNEDCEYVDGFAVCTCSDPTGVDCAACVRGYVRRPSDATCVPTCAAPGFTCPTNAGCEDSDTGARCVCEPGHDGASCEQCEAGASTNSQGDCARPIPDEAALLLVARTEQRSYLGALVKPGLSFVPIVPIDDAVTDIAWATEPQVLYALAEGVLHTVDLANGELSAVSSAVLDLGTALVATPDGETVYTGSANGVWRLDVASGDVALLASLAAESLALDSADERLLVLTAAGGRAEISLPQGGVEDLAPIQGVTAFSVAGITFEEDTGFVYLVGGQPESETERLVRHCRTTARRLGVAASGSELLGSFAPDAAPRADLVLSDDGVDPPLVIYGSSGTADAVHTLRIDTQHADAVVCVAVEGEPLDVVVSDDARFRLLVLESAEDSLSLEFESDSLAEGATVHVLGVTTQGTPSQVKSYTDAEWAERGLVSFAAEPPLATPTVGLLDWTAGVGSYQALTTAELTGAVTVWEE